MRGHGLVGILVVAGHWLPVAWPAPGVDPKSRSSQSMPDQLFLVPCHPLTGLALGSRAIRQVGRREASGSTHAAPSSSAQVLGRTPEGVAGGVDWDLVLGSGVDTSTFGLAPVSDCPSQLASPAQTRIQL